MESKAIVVAKQTWEGVRVNWAMVIQQKLTEEI